MSKTSIVFGYLMLLSYVAASQTKVWSYKECLDYAMTHNTQMREGEFSKRSVELSLYQAKKAFVPTITAGTSANIGIGRTIDPFTNEFTNDPVFSNSWNVNVAMPIFQGFKLHANLKKAHLNVKTNELTNTKTSRDLQIQIANAYLQIVFNLEQLKNAERQLSLRQAQLMRIEKLIEAGRKPKRDAYDMQVQVTNATVQIVAAKNNLLISKLNLKQLLSLPAEEEFDIVPPTTIIPDSSFLLLSPTDVFGLTHQLQETQLNQLAVKQAEIDLQQAKRSYLPSLSVSYGVGTGFSSQTVTFIPGVGEVQQIINPIGYVSPDGGQTMGETVYQETFIGPDPVATQMALREQFSQNFNQSTNININIPFLSAASSLKQGVRTARVNLEKARMRATNDQNQLKQMLFQKFVEAQAAYQTYRLNREKLQVQELAYQATASRFEKGQVNYLTYIMAENNLADSQNELLRSKYDATLKIKILRFYMGEPLSF